MRHFLHVPFCFPPQQLLPERIGGGIVIDGRVLRGAHCFAGEFSFLRNDVGPDSDLGLDLFSTSCGWRGLRDMVAAEKGIKSDDSLDGHRIFEWVEAGDPAALRALSRYARAFDATLVNLQCVIDPEVFVISGGISARPELLAAMRAEMPAAVEAYKVFGGIPEPQVKAAELGNDANLAGAVQEAMRLR